MPSCAADFLSKHFHAQNLISHGSRSLFEDGCGKIPELKHLETQSVFVVEPVIGDNRQRKILIAARLQLFCGRPHWPRGVIANHVGELDPKIAASPHSEETRPQRTLQRRPTLSEQQDYLVHERGIPIRQPSD